MADNIMDFEVKNDPPGFARLPPSSLRTLLQAHDITPEALSALAEDSSYIVRQVIHQAMLFMRHSGRDKLLPQDVNKALKWGNAAAAHGHIDMKPMHSKRGRKPASFVRDVSILGCIEKAESFKTQPVSRLNAQWVVVEGVPLYTSRKTASGHLSKKGKGIVEQFVPEKKWSASDINNVSEDYIRHFGLVKDAIMSEHEPLSKMALADLQKNPKLSPLLPHFLNFIDDEVRKHNHDLAQIKKLLNFIKALLRNPFMYLGHEVCLSPLVRSVLYCIIEPQERGPEQISSSHWAVRDQAANLLKVIIDQWATPVNSQYEHTLPELQKVFRNLNKPMWSFYGAIVAITALGPEAIEEALYPFMGELVRHVDKVRQKNFEASTNPDMPSNFRWNRAANPAAAEDSSEQSETRVRKDLYIESVLAEIEGVEKVHDALLNSAEVYLRSKMKAETVGQTPQPTRLLDSTLSSDSPTHPTEFPDCPHRHGTNSYTEDSGYKKKSLPAVYKDLYKYFGESLAIRLPMFSPQAYGIEVLAPKKAVVKTVPVENNCLMADVSLPSFLTAPSRFNVVKELHKAGESSKSRNENVKGTRPSTSARSDNEVDKEEGQKTKSNSCYQSNVPKPGNPGLKVVIKKVKQ